MVSLMSKSFLIVTAILCVKVERIYSKDFGAPKSITILPGIEIVSSPALTNGENRNFASSVNSKSLLDYTLNFLGSHDLKVKLDRFTNTSDVSQVYEKVINVFDSQASEFSEARKKDKGGLGYVLMMGLMMGKTLAALGFGGVAALAAKALGASLAALMLSALVGLKKMTDHGHSDSGSSHHVQYYTADHH